jgi:hypothetical protein
MEKGVREIKGNWLSNVNLFAHLAKHYGSMMLSNYWVPPIKIQFTQLYFHPIRTSFFPHPVAVQGEDGQAGVILFSITGHPIAPQKH